MRGVALERWRRVVLAAAADSIALLVEFVAPACAAWQFVEVHEEAGLVYEHRISAASAAEWSAGGVAAGDFDGDG
ncbi:MAG: hypothetical protein N3C12_16065 [Candidatus Binatia bacterium]|nr:hypothetical protein [Candidatus Binatia bacterium]